VLAGNLSALSLFWEQRKRRSELMLYCLPRGVEVVWRLLREAGFVSDVSNAGTVMFASAMAVTFAVSRKDLKPALQGLLWVLLGEPAHDLTPLKPEKVNKAVNPGSRAAASQHVNPAKK
jgi:hypothetical protein